MLFIGEINIDPSEITKIKKVEPNSFFKRFLYTISNGKINDQIEEENFTAISILQQFRSVLKSMNVNNIIRLSHNDEDYFLDKMGNDDDLDLALKDYKSGLNNEKSGSFKTISLVMEHNEDTFHYYIEIKINRSHKVGAYPIEVKIDGLINEFFEHLIDKPRLKNKMEHVFRSQDAYDFYLTSKKNEFEFFIKTVAEEIKKNIKVDGIKLLTDSAILLPTKFISNPGEIECEDYSKSPAFHGYYQSRERLWYIYIWPELCNEHNIYVNNTRILSDSGNMIGKLDEQGIEAGDSPLFDLSSDLESEYQEIDEKDKDENDDKKEDWF